MQRRSAGCRSSCTPHAGHAKAGDDAVPSSLPPPAHAPGAMQTGQPEKQSLIRPLVLIDAADGRLGVKEALQRSIEAGCRAIILQDEEACTAGLPQMAAPRGAARCDGVRAAARSAARMGMTHLIILEARCGVENNLDRILAQIKAAPEAVICGVCPGPFDLWQRFRQAMADFWFRVETGIGLKQSTGRLRAYPLDLVLGLRTLSRNSCFDYEMLVRSVWAGADIRQVALGADLPAGCGKSRKTGLVKRLFFAVLTIHLTMRSIVPWPHRRIVGPEGSGAAAKVSVLSPWRSLKMLVGQNIPADRLGFSAALGIFLGTLPLIGFHSIAILFAAGYFRLSKVAALGASQLCMPPLVPALCIEVGHYLRHGTLLTEVSLRTLGYEAIDRLVEWLIGSLLLAPALGALIGVLVYLAAQRIARRSVAANAVPVDGPADCTKAGGPGVDEPGGHEK